jgi:hypothetical protein
MLISLFFPPFYFVGLQARARTRERETGKGVGGVVETKDKSGNHPHSFPPIHPPK